MVKQPTLRDIAEKAGVSVSTVSRVLNDRPGIGAETRTRVLNVAQELRFVPNAAAKSLVTKRTGNIGLVGFKRTVPARFISSSLDSVGINDECERNGYHVLTSQVGLEAMKNPLHLPMVREQRVDGLILAGPALEPSFVLELYNSGLPIVLLDNSLRGTEIDCVLHENETGCYRLTHHLINHHQHKSVVFLSGPEAWLSSRERAAGYLRALTEASLAPQVLYMPETTVETGMEAMQAVLSGGRQATAVVCVNDAVAIGAARACKAAGCSIPESMAISGFDDVGWAQHHEPPLTTVHAYGEEMGRQAARRLIELIETEPEQEHVRLRLRVGVRVIIRRSCGCHES